MYRAAGVQSQRQASPVKMGDSVMAKFTGPDGSKVTVDPKRVIRIRETISGENSGSKTRIDWTMMSLVKETLSEVVPVVQAILDSLTSLTALEGKKIWFDAKQAVGPLPITDTQKKLGFNSSIKIMGYRQYVIESPAKVRAVIKSAHGDPLDDN